MKLGNNGHSRLATLLLLWLLLAGGCVKQPSLLPLHGDEIPFFYDDAFHAPLLNSLAHQIDYLKTGPSEKETVIENTTYNRSDLISSLKHFSDILSSSTHPFILDNSIRENYLVYQAGGRKKDGRNVMLVTGYYEPLLEGSLTKKRPFIYPLYSKPDSLLHRKNKKTHQIEKGRVDDRGNFLPYWTRGEIEKHDMAKGYELVYLKNRFDAFILHIQGSGKIRLRDGSLRSVHYATDNGRKYNSIGKLLADEKKMALKDVTIPTIKEFLKQHPNDQERIYFHNKKFIFFKWEKEDGPFGSIGKPLTPGRSIAIDGKALPMTAIGYLITRQPVFDSEGRVAGWKPLHRFVIPQDTGSAIKGTGRVDIFFGNGEGARATAGIMKEPGKLYFLIKK